MTPRPAGPGRGPGPGPGPAPAPRRPGRRRGIVLVVVGALVVVIAIGAFMFRQATLQQYRDAHRFTSSTIALNLAESGLNAALERFLEASLTPGTEVHSVLLGRGYDALNGTRLELPSPHLELLLEVLGPTAEVSVYAELDGFRPLHPSQGLRGVVGDPREKLGELKLVGEGSYRGVKRRIVASRQVRVISVVAPVVSKFTLFLRQRPEQDLNPLQYRRLDPQAGFRFRGEPARPLVLYNRPEVVPAIEGGRFLPLGDVFSDADPDNGGLIFLGGDQPWYLQLTHGVGANLDEELFHLRRARYLLDSPLPQVTKEIGMTFGIYEGILESPKFRSYRPPANYPRQGGQHPDVSDRVAALHLYGDVRNVSPTVVLGPVFRSYVTMRLLDGLWYPPMSRDEFSSRPDQEVFQGRYDIYQDVMVRVTDEAYNRSYDYIATNYEDLGEDGSVASNDTPFRPGPTLADRGLLRVQPITEEDRGYLYPSPDQPAPGSCRITRLEEGGELVDLFRGALADLDGAVLEAMLRAKAVKRVADQGAFRREFMAGPDLDVPGVVLIEGGDLELGPTNVRVGSMVVVQGSIDITDRVVQLEEGQPLTLVSLSGDIHIRTGAKVDAHLVALRGRVSSRGPLELVGGIAAETLDLHQMIRGDEPKRITYNPALDPTSPENTWRHLRVVMDDQIRLALDTVQ